MLNIQVSLLQGTATNALQTFQMIPESLIMYQNGSVRLLQMRESRMTKQNLFLMNGLR